MNTPVNDYTPVVDSFGFVFSRYGCSCAGSPPIYLKRDGAKFYELTIYPKRTMWRLVEHSYQIAQGNTPESLQTQLQTIIQSN